MALESVAEEYFSNLNPIASRICTDLQETKAAYEKLWQKLSQEEKEQILTDTIIKPEVLIKYGSQETKSNDEYAVKIVVDEHCSYQDEHSGPFSFRTRSQRNLTIFQQPKIKATNEGIVKPKVSTKAKPAPKPPSVSLYSKELHVEDRVGDISIEPTQNSKNSTLPKTGLDFLDNW